MDFLAGHIEADPAEYGERIGGRYDEWYGSRDDAAPIADFLAARAGGHPALELGIGTGRIALPLAERGVRVDGIDASPRMVEQLRGKPGGGDIAVSIGDFASVDAPGGPYGLIYVVFNTFLMLPTQDDQETGSCRDRPRRPFDSHWPSPSNSLRACACGMAPGRPAADHSPYSARVAAAWASSSS